MKNEEEREIPEPSFQFIYKSDNKEDQKKELDSLIRKRDRMFELDGLILGTHNNPDDRIRRLREKYVYSSAKGQLSDDELSTGTYLYASLMIQFREYRTYNSFTYGKDNIPVDFFALDEYTPAMVTIKNFVKFYDWCEENDVYYFAYSFEAWFGKKRKATVLKAARDIMPEKAEEVETIKRTCKLFDIVILEDNGKDLLTGGKDMFDGSEYGLVHHKIRTDGGQEEVVIRFEKV